METNKDVANMYKPLAYQNQSMRVNLGMFQFNYIQALSWWTYNHHKNGLALYVSVLIPAFIRNVIEIKRTKREQVSYYTAVKDISKFDPDIYLITQYAVSKIRISRRDVSLHCSCRCSSD